MPLNKKQKLQAELAECQKKMAQLCADWAESKGGSRYGDEYVEVQIKVYESMIGEIKAELVKIKP